MNTLQQGMVLHGKSREYKIEKVLGQGSFGITYLATTKLKVQGELGTFEVDTKVAVKEFFMKDLNGREGTRVTSISTGGKEGLYEKYKSKFIKESQNLSKLQHPGIVKVLESFETNGTAYYVMEYCEGGSLEERIKSHGGLGEGEAKSLAFKIGDALSYMHSRGMLHLDLKPGNIMLRADGTPVVIDFGLSKQYTSDGKAESSTTVGLGTPGYAPIEQGDYQESKGKFPVTMDVYAFGATVFKMLTGNTPPKASEVMNHGFPAYELQDKNVSITTIRAIKKAMADRVVDRCQTVNEFVALLAEEPNTIIESDDTIHEAPKPKPPTPPAPPKPTPTPPAPKPGYLKYILGVLAVVLGVVIGVVLTNNDPSLEAVVAEEAVVDTTAVVEPLTTQREEQERLAEEQRKREQAEADRKQREEQERIAEEQRKQEEAARKQREEQERIAEEQRNARKQQSGIFTANGVTFKMIAVQGGTYTMGATSEQGSDAYSDEKPAHNEYVSDFMIGETEVTQELWQAVMGSNPSNFTGDMQRPVERVSWDDCQTFIRKLNQLTGQNFRLPSEAEWEYAARGGNRSNGYKYAGSNSVGTVAWYGDNSGSTTHKVKTKQPNELGIYDMSGNVWEWCQDKWCDNYNSPRNSGGRVLRGGSWISHAGDVRVSSRIDNTPGNWDFNYGLRLAL
ncbi:MAG: SUMF1/EgtB/PvdO family nonheme iron enzyme [Bacteroidales bacterium]|nr:SUMF1/EgtB/PvdO family nonheme iron enzyme [Bacteroidales bacterium]